MTATMLIRVIRTHEMKMMFEDDDEMKMIML